jgi:putative membrane protein
MKTRSSFVPLTAPAIVAFTGVAAIMGDPYDHMDGWGVGWWIWMPIMMVLVWGGIIAVIVWAVSRLAGDREKRGGDQRKLEGPSPLDIAKERYARGEITREQFEQLRHDLS